jgi:hypothetical protein
MIEPVVGWRLWKLRDGQLDSWAVDYRWEPGENHATCLAPDRQACLSSPGRHCQCGLWALWSPRRCVARASSAAEAPWWHVMGLVAGWGTVALHHDEGFRAEYAALCCLFTDRPWSAWMSGVAPGWLARWWRRRSGRQAEPDPYGDAVRDPRRWEALQVVAERYAVPLVSLGTAANVGLLSELGVPPPQVEEARRLGAATAETRFFD